MNQPTVWVPYHILVEAADQLQHAHKKYGPFTALKPKMQLGKGVNDAGVDPGAVWLIRRVSVYAIRLPNAQLQALTQ